MEKFKALIKTILLTGFMLGLICVMFTVFTPSTPQLPTVEDNILNALDSTGIVLGYGSGFGSVSAIEPNVVLTAGHCIGLGDTVVIDGQGYYIEDQWSDPVYDVGFIVIEDANLPTLEFGEFPILLEEVYIIGCPFTPELINSITEGLVSHLDRDIWTYTDAIQVSAFSAGGNSGSPVLDEEGKIIGILVAGPNHSGDCIGICEPVNHILEALDRWDNRYAIP